MIQMIAGVYGLPVKQDNGTIRIVGMGPNSGPFSIDKDREAELVAKKVARYVEETPAKVEEKQPPVEGGNALGTEGGTNIPKYSADMKADELKAIGAQFGLTFKVGMKKVDMVAELDKLFAEKAAGDEDEGGNALGTEGNEDVDGGDGAGAPAFDPADAVQ